MNFFVSSQICVVCEALEAVTALKIVRFLVSLEMKCEFLLSFEATGTLLTFIDSMNTLMMLLELISVAECFMAIFAAEDVSNHIKLIRSLLNDELFSCLNVFDGGNEDIFILEVLS